MRSSDGEVSDVGLGGGHATLYCAVLFARVLYITLMHKVKVGDE